MAGSGVTGAEELSLLFRGLSALEEMVRAVRATGEPPAADPELVAALGAELAEPEPSESEAPKKKARGW